MPPNSVCGLDVMVVPKPPKPGDAVVFAPKSPPPALATALCPNSDAGCCGWAPPNVNVDVWAGVPNAGFAPKMLP